ncbi:MAG: ABC transporter substrate-binding protein [Bacteroidales bacterium]|nr:ABC transporter substrate-binding protein [Bacteroidales bacterium]
MGRKGQALLPVVLALVAFTSAGAQERFVFTPQWTAQAQFAGYYVALEQGFYKELGLDVEIVHPSASTPALERARRNQCQATTLQLCQAMEIIDNGIPLVNILQTSMNNAMVIISRRGQDPLTQKGARVGTWSVGFGQIAMCLSRKEHLDYEWIRFASSVNLFTKGALDAILAMSYNEYYQVLQTGIELSDKDVYRFCDHGYNIQEDGVYMYRSYYLKHKDQARRFAEASRRGWEWAAEHPEETLDIVMKYVTANHIATNRTLQKLMLAEVLRLQVDKDSGGRDFRLRPDMVKLASDLMTEGGLIRKEVSYEQLVGE